MNPEKLKLLVTREMPYGKYQGRLLADLPGDYVNWFARKGFPAGELGSLLALMHEVDHNGLAACSTRCEPALASLCGQTRSRRRFDLPE